MTGLHMPYTRLWYLVLVYEEENGCTITGIGTLKPVRISLADSEVENVEVI